MSTIEDVNMAREGKTVVFTNGVFDILHAGHVDYLEKAAKLGDLLVVGLNSDDSVRRLGKGPDRPINPIEDRMKVIEALRCVAFAICFEEDTPTETIAKLKPDIHVKGGDYDPEKMPETPTVRSYGGKVVILPLLEGRSTSNIANKLKQQS